MEAESPAATRVRTATLEGRPIRVLSPEDLAVFKLLFFRGKDVVDLERLVAFLGPELDHGYVRSWVSGMVGEDDERIACWDRMVEEFGRSR